MKILSNQKIILIIALLGLALLCAIYLFWHIDYKYLNWFQRSTVSSVAEKWKVKMDSLEDHAQNKVELAELLRELNPIEKNLVNRILAIPAGELGFRGPYYGIATPEKLSEIPSKVFTNAKGKKDTYETEIQYYPERAWRDFEAMNAQMQQDIGKQIWNDSGYRSPGKQAYLFFKYLADTEDGNNFSLLENAKWIALPGYSEHGSAETPALDFAIDGGDSVFEKADGTDMSSEESQNFLEKTAEYQWMLKNAEQYNFFLSYPRDNKYGVNFEPWHWHWESP